LAPWLSLSLSLFLFQIPKLRWVELNPSKGLGPMALSLSLPLFLFQIPKLRWVELNPEW